MKLKRLIDTWHIEKWIIIIYMCVYNNNSKPHDNLQKYHWFIYEDVNVLFNS